MKRSEFPSVNDHGKEALNFQLSATIYVCVTVVLMFVGSFLCLGWLLIPVPFVIYYGAIIYSIIAGIKANDGILYRYPFNLRLIK